MDIVRIPDVHLLDLPEIEMRLIHSTASVPDLFFERVAGAVFLPDSSLVIADARLYELTLLDPDGSVRGRSGREGEGPGEYTQIERIGVGVDGVPFVFDRRQRRFTFLDSRGAVTDVHRLGQGAGLGAAVPLSRLETGEMLAALETRPALPPGLQRGPVFLVLADDSGEIVDTLGEWAGKERHVSDDQEIWNPVGFGPTALFAGRGEHALVGTNDSLDLTLHRGTVPVTRIRGGYSPRRVTAGEKDEWTESFLGMFPEDYPGGLAPEAGAVDGARHLSRLWSDQRRRRWENLDWGLPETGRRDAPVDRSRGGWDAGVGGESSGASPQLA